MELIFIHHVILTVVVCSMTSHAMVSRSFKVHVNSTGGSVCAVDTPSTVIQLAASTMAGQCGVMCNVDPSCELFQFKEDSAQCELFKYSPSNFTTVDHCTAYATPPDDNECLTGNGGCDTNATCTITIGSRTCQCHVGFSGDGLTCTDINECLTASGGCDTNATCTNTIGSRTCRCHVGFSGDGLTCTDINDCLTGNGGCDTNATCMNTIGSRTCQCHVGFTGNGLTCTDINECQTGSGGCDTNANCRNTIGSRTCHCHAGFTGDGLICTDINECSTDNGGCATNATCTNTVGSRTCECDCQAGLYGDGLNCSTGYNGIGLLVQQHYYGSTFFQRTWNEFKAGFGDVSSNYWIGNEQLHTLTSSGQYRLRVDLQARANCQWYWAEYSTFIVESETNFYRLTIGEYSGTAGDAMVATSYTDQLYVNLNGMMFTTLDADHDQCGICNCAITPVVGYTCGGGFWNRNCNNALINTPSTCGFTWEGLPTADWKLMYTRLTLI